MGVCDGLIDDEEERAMAGDRGTTNLAKPKGTSSRSTSEGDLPFLASVAEADLSQAITNVEIPLFVWDDLGAIQLANESAADLVGRSLGELEGTLLTDYASPADLVERAIASMVAGQFDRMASRRTLKHSEDYDVPVLATSKAIEVDGIRGGVTMFVRESELGRLGTNPALRVDLVPVCVGVSTTDWVMTAISAEVHQVLDRTPEGCVGERLTSLVHPDDLPLMIGDEQPPPSVPTMYPLLRFATGLGSWRTICLLVAPRGDSSPLFRFALVGSTDDFLPQNSDRIRELELRLWRIGAEVRAAGLINAMDPRPDLRNFPQLGELTTRQWEILNRLLNGKRVPTIASELFISQSTVRNHLATIFAKFNVHSQAELVELLRSSPG
jgi:DNA-binding CsgD family transcriptional regulator